MMFELLIKKFRDLEIGFWVLIAIITLSIIWLIDGTAGQSIAFIIFASIVWLKFTETFKQYTIRQHQADFDAGYNWAKEEIIINNKTPEEVESYVYSLNHPFDRGARVFLRDYKNEEVTCNEEYY